MASPQFIPASSVHSIQSIPTFPHPQYNPSNPSNPSNPFQHPIAYTNEMAMLPLLLLTGLLSHGADFDSKIASVLPTAEENRWLQIPWRLDLEAARKEAAEQKKPLFVWMMNGHPMGCT